MQDSQTVIEELIQECLGRMAEEGEQALERVCEQHPAHADTLRRVMRSLSRVGLVDAGATPTHHPDRLGDYRLLHRIGGGGMGEVYLAEQVGLGRRVALKLIRGPFGASPTTRARFRREIDAVSQLDHVGICPVYDAGEIEGTLFLAMRYVEGETLAARIKRVKAEAGPTSTDTTLVLRMIEKVARALHVAHEKGLVHRDIKPGNIMITPDGEPVLLDFGLAMQAEDSEKVPSSLTASGERLGTPAYMSPEQVSSRSVDRRTDIYSLGATLYEALTLHCPHEAPTREALFHEILSGKISRASHWNRQVPRDVEVVLETALDPDPDRRYQTALDLAEDLQRIRQQAPIRARPLPISLRFRRWTQRNRVASVAILMLALGLAVSGVLLVELKQSLVRRNAVLLAHAAGEALEKDQTLGLLLARKALKLWETPETVSALHAAYAQAHEYRVFRQDRRVHSVCFSPDRRSVLVGTGGGSYRQARIWLWDLKTKSHREFLDAPAGFAHDVSVAAVALSPSGKRAASVDRLGRVKIWDCATGRRQFETLEVGIGEQKPDMWPSLSQVLFVDEDHFLTADGAGPGYVDRRNNVRVALWRVGVPQPVWELPLPKPVISLDVSSDQSALLVAALDGVKVFSWPKGRLPERTPRCRIRGAIRADLLRWAAFDPQEQRIVTAAIDGWIDLWNADGEHLRGVGQLRGGAFMARFSPDGQTVLATGIDLTVSLFDLRTGKSVGLRGHSDKVISADFDPTGARVVTGGDQTARVWDVSVPEAPVFRHEAQVLDAVIDTKRRRVLTGSRDFTACLWSLDGTLIKKLPHSGPVGSVAFSPDGEMLATGQGTTGLQLVPGTATYDATLYLWDREGNRVGHLPAGELEFVALRFADDGRMLFATTSDVRFVDRPGGKPHIVALPKDSVGAHEYVAGASLAGNGQVMVSGHDGQVWLWDTHSTDVQGPLMSTGDYCWFSELSPDGRRIVTTHPDGTWRMWTKKGELLFTKHGHEGVVEHAAFSPRGDLVATASRDRSARLWTIDGTLVASFEAHDGAVSRVAFSADGSRVITASDDGTARVWITDTRELIRRARDRSARDFTPEELSRYGNLFR